MVSELLRWGFLALAACSFAGAVALMTPEGRGLFGELKVRLLLAIWFPCSDRFHNVYLRRRTKLVQIDHVVINERGVFVVETKNWSGMIRADATWRHWYVRYANGEWHRMYNPLRQNEGHCRAVARALRAADVPVYGAVLMVGRGWFGTPRPRGVMGPFELRWWASLKAPKCVPPATVAELAADLRAVRVPATRRIARQHRQAVSRHRQ